MTTPFSNPSPTTNENKSKVSPSRRQTVEESVPDFQKEVQHEAVPGESTPRKPCSIIRTRPLAPEESANRQIVKFAIDLPEVPLNPSKREKKLSVLWETIKPPWKTDSNCYLSSPSRMYRKLSRSPSSSSGRLCSTIPMRWLFLTFRDREVEQRYKTNFYSNKSSLNTIEQALIIFLVRNIEDTSLLSSIIIIILFHYYYPLLLFHYYYFRSHSLFRQWYTFNYLVLTEKLNSRQKYRSQ